MDKRKMITINPDRQIKVALGLLLVLVAVASRTVGPLWGLSLHMSAFLWWIVILAVSWGQGTFLMRLMSLGRGCHRQAQNYIPAGSGFFGLQESLT